MNESQGPIGGGIDFNMGFGNFNPEEVEVDETINAVFVVDVSSSIYNYVNDLNTAFNDFVARMQKSHVAERLFVSIVEFNDKVMPQTGFQPIGNIQHIDFQQNIGGTTALYDAVKVGLENAISYRETLENSGVNAKTLVFIITDGDDNASSSSPGQVKDLIGNLLQEERNYFSFTSILFGIGTGKFKEAKEDMGVEHLATISDSADDIRKMINFISASVSSVSAGQGVTTPNF